MMHRYTHRYTYICRPSNSKTSTNHYRSYMKHTPLKSIPPITVQQNSVNITYDSKMLFIGSCFSQTMAEKLSSLKFDSQVNPSHGIIFNPQSIAECISRTVFRTYYKPCDIIQDSIHNDIFHSWHHHSTFSSTNPDTMLANINSSLDTAHEHLLRSQTIFITLGSARVHTLVQAPSISNNHNNKLSSCNQEMVVANCHKQPSSFFNHRYLSVEEVKSSLLQAMGDIWTINPSAQIVFTVSPVRHLREGVIENSMSKSTLLCAVHAVIAAAAAAHSHSECQDGNNDNKEEQHTLALIDTLETEERGGVQYFPSYEIMLDELRDYGYYKDDFVHPSTLSENIIFRRFMDTFVLNEDTRLLCEKIGRVLSGVNHRPLMETTQAYKSHLLLLLKQLNEISLLSEKTSTSIIKKKIDFSFEREHIIKCLERNFDHDDDDIL